MRYADSGRLSPTVFPAPVEVANLAVSHYRFGEVKYDDRPAPPPGVATAVYAAASASADDNADAAARATAGNDPDACTAGHACAGASRAAPCGPDHRDDLDQGGRSI